MVDSSSYSIAKHRTTLYTVSCEIAMTREERARCILKLCETVARNALPDVDDVDDEDMEAMKRAYFQFTTKVRYLMRQSEAAWTPAFGKILSTSCCMSVVCIQKDNKERKRGFSGRCMACNREESNCRYAVNLAGNIDPDAWMQGPEAMLRSYNTFVEEYDSVFDKDFSTKVLQSGSLPSMDKGCYIVGETCLRKAKIRFILQTLLLEVTYDAERAVEDLVKNGTNLDPSVIYTATEESVKDFIDIVDKLELAIADNKRAVPSVRVDESYWQVLDDISRELAGYDDQEADNIAFERANNLLDQVSGESEERKEGDAENENRNSGMDSDHENKADEFHKTKRRGAKNKRKRIIEDTDDECSPINAQSHGEEGDMTDHPEPIANTSSVHTGTYSRKETTSAESFAGLARSETRLPSRKRALVELMRLQVKLTEEGRDTESAVCTNAIFTIQELMKRVERV